jgi:hypothetical protein
MPLQHGDIEVFSIATRTIKLANGKMVEAKEIRYRVRGETEDVLYIPLDEFSKSHAEQLLLRAAAEIIDLLDQFPVKG